MSNLECSKNKLAFGLTALTIAFAPLGCSSGNSDVAASAGPSDGAERDDDDTARVSHNAVTLEDTLSAREANQQREDEARVSFTGSVERQAQLGEVLRQQLPERLPAFADASARTRLAELSGPDLLGALGYSLDLAGALEGDKLVFDDGAVRLRTSVSVPGYFKFADRAALYQAHRMVGHTTPAPLETIESTVAVTLEALGVPKSEMLRVKARAVTLETGARGGETHEYGAAAFVSNVQRQVGGLPVLGSACTLALDLEGTLTWARCRWPQFRASSATAEARPYEAIVSDMARQLDRSLEPSASVTDVQLSVGFAYEERVTDTGVEYVPVLRTILSSPGQAAGEFTALVREPLSMVDDAPKPAHVQF